MPCQKCLRKVSILMLTNVRISIFFSQRITTPANRRVNEGADEVMTPAEHLKWTKGRALEYLDAGDLKNAFASMASDLSKHEAFTGPTYTMLNQLGMMELINQNTAGMRRWIEGFN
jgi:hypothetical protein